MKSHNEHLSCSILLNSLATLSNTKMPFSADETLVLRKVIGEMAYSVTGSSIDREKLVYLWDGFKERTNDYFHTVVGDEDENPLSDPFEIAVFATEEAVQSLLLMNTVG